MASFCVQNMCEMLRKHNRDLFTDNICKLGRAAERSPTTHVIHEYETDKRDSTFIDLSDSVFIPTIRTKDFLSTGF